jgi:hypothetical protein
VDAIVPAAGLASRMRGIPKFLLPCDDVYTTLLEEHLGNLLEVCETVWIPTRPELVMLLDSLSISRDRIVILPITTRNMTETVLHVANLSRADFFQLVMPDTFFLGEKPYQMMSKNPKLVDLACWKIRKEQRGKLGQVKIHDNRVIDMRDKDPKCEFEHSWGALTFYRDLLTYCKDSDSHIGYAVKTALENNEEVNARVIEGKYFDCGTPSEYLDLLRESISK